MYLNIRGFFRTVGICQDLQLIEEAVYHEKTAQEIETDKNERAK